MQAPQSVQTYQPVAESPSTTDISYVPNKSYFFTPQAHLTIPNVSITPSIESNALIEYMLITVGKHLATTLVHVLDQLSDYNQEAIYPIISIIEPYLERNRELHAAMPPKSSREVVVNITREGKAKPKASLD